MNEGIAIERATSLAPHATPRKLTRNRLLIIGASIIGLLGLFWYGYDWWTFGRFTETTDDAYVGGDVTGIAPKVAGFIATVEVSDN
jgi:membrane fusion protein (multidrug efflux system)